jgi:hypothetical protein
MKRDEQRDGERKEEQDKEGPANIFIHTTARFLQIT